MRAAVITACPVSPSASLPTGPTCNATRNWIRTTSLARRLYCRSRSASSGASGSTTRCVEIVGGTTMTAPSPRSSR